MKICFFATPPNFVKLSWKIVSDNLWTDSHRNYASDLLFIWQYFEIHLFKDDRGCDKLFWPNVSCITKHNLYSSIHLKFGYLFFLYCRLYFCSMLLFQPLQDYSMYMFEVGSLWGWGQTCQPSGTPDNLQASSSRGCRFKAWVEWVLGSNLKMHIILYSFYKFLSHLLHILFASEEHLKSASFCSCCPVLLWLCAAIAVAEWCVTG